MWDLAVREEDYARADSLLRRKFTPQKLPLGHRALLAIVRHDSTARAQLLEESRRQTSGYPYAPKWIAVHLNDFPAADEFARAALASPRSATGRAQVHQILALIALGQGRWSSAQLEFGLARQAFPSVDRMRALSAT
jgi:hypothetical protein